MTAQRCEVCNDAEAKYRCPHCELRYCSLQCFKLHKPLHESDTKTIISSTARDESSTTLAQPQDAQQPVKRNPYTALQSHPHFQPLFTKYPKLKSQLQRVHQATLNPYQPSQTHQGERPRIRDRVQGQWTQDKADELAAKVLASLAKEDEGVRDFVDLVGQVFKGDGKKAGRDEA